MSQRTRGLYFLTQVPALYTSFQDAIGAERSRKELVASFIKPKAGDRILDVGCGPGAMLPYLGDVSYYGVDLNEKHIAEAKSKYGNRGTFHCGHVNTASDMSDKSFDIVISVGVLHHLKDSEVTGLFSMAAQMLAKNGRMVTIDPTLIEGQHWVAKTLAKLDSGECVRHPNAYEALARSAFGKVEVVVRHDLLRVPYSHCIMTASNL
jgi:2-polyprenyl-3-methyl-5-hydroxy-6-metoxy-1,4-benzoquinol methylase